MLTEKASGMPQFFDAAKVIATSYIVICRPLGTTLSSGRIVVWLHDV